MHHAWMQCCAVAVLQLGKPLRPRSALALSKCCPPGICIVGMPSARSFVNPNRAHALRPIAIRRCCIRAASAQHLPDAQQCAHAMRRVFAPCSAAGLRALLHVRALLHHVEPNRAPNRSPSRAEAWARFEVRGSRLKLGGLSRCCLYAYMRTDAWSTDVRDMFRANKHQTNLFGFC